MKISAKQKHIKIFEIAKIEFENSDASLLIMHKKNEKIRSNSEF